MDIVLAFLFGIGIGLVLHYALPGRDSRGVALLPAVGALAGGAVWLALTWAGLTTDNPLLWVLSILAAVVVTVPVGVVLSRVRATHDAREKSRLKIG